MRKTSRQLTTRIFRTTLISFVAGTVAAGAIFIGAYIAFPLEGVSVSGTRMVPKSDVERLVSSRTSLLTLNTESLEAEVESNPWVQSASIHRNWQKREVVVDVEERVAVLRASVDGETRVFSSDRTMLPGDGGVDLPVVEMKDWQIPEVLGVARVLELGDAGLQSVDSVGIEGITASVAGRRVLLPGTVGDDQVDTLRDVIRDNPEPATFDLRSPGRVVVSGVGKNGDVRDPETPAG